MSGVRKDRVPKRRKCTSKPPMEIGIVAYPISPGLFRICPKCHAWFALRFYRFFDDSVVGRVEVYRCKCCSAEVSFAEGSPDHCVE
jgi:hypothetical protein